MPKKEEKKKKSLLNKVERVGGAAIAMGATAALLYNNGGSKALSSGISRASALLDEVGSDISNRALKDFDLDTTKSLIKKHITGEDSTWKRTEEIGNKIRLNQESHRGLVGYLNAAIQQKENKYQTLGKMFESDYRANLTSKLNTKFSGQDDSKRGTIKKAVNKTLSNVSEAFRLDENNERFINDEFLEKVFKKSEFDPQEQVKIMEEILLAHDEKPQASKDFMEEHKDLVENIYKKMIDKDELVRKFGSAKEDKNFFDTVLENSRATVNDLLDNQEQFTNRKLNILKSGQETNGLIQKDIMEVLQDLKDKDESFGDLYVDKLIRKDESGDLYSFEKIGKTFKEAVDSFSNTLPGKIAKTRDMSLAYDAPSLKIFGRGTADPILAAKMGSKSSFIDDHLVFINDKVYKTVGEELEHLKELDGGYLQSGRFGLTSRTVKNIAGDSDYIEREGLMRAFDINSSGRPNKLDEFKSIFTKFDDDRWGQNLISSFFSESDEDIYDQYDNLLELNKFFKSTTEALDPKTINSLSESATSSRSKALFDILKLDDEEMIEKIFEYEPDYFSNTDLKSVIKRYAGDTKSTMDIKNIVSDNEVFLSHTKAITQSETIRKEISKEAFLKEVEDGKGLNSIVDLFDNAKLKGNRRSEAEYLANWAAFQDATDVYSSTSKQTKELGEMFEAIRDNEYMFKATGESEKNTLNNEYFIQFQENMKRMAREKAPSTQRGFSSNHLDENFVEGVNYGDYIYMQKAISPIAALNNETKRKAFKNQLTAGRSNMEDITTATIFPYFSISRLIDPLSAVGLSFSPESTGSVTDYAINTMTKRVLPIMGGITALSYLDYEAKNLTGTSLRGAAANSLANIDLGARRISDKIGLGGIIEQERDINPISQYYFDEHQSAEEREEWYRNGLSPVKKGRFWSFGSTSEFFGGKIDYFEPNYVKRANSDWHDIGVYGSSKEKWKHSLIPTPRHPLSTFRRIADPYHLENKNYWSRPYPVTGKMFEEGTPWGAVLNPTVGAIIKPQKEMHKKELGNTLVDVRDLIALQNQEIRRRAADNTDLIRVGEEGFEPVSFTPLTQPSEDESIMSFSLRDGEVNRSYKDVEDLNYEGMPIEEYEELHDIVQERADGIGEGKGMATSSFSSGSSGSSFSIGGGSSLLPLVDRLQISSDSGNILAGIVNQTVPMSNYNRLKEINDSIRERAASRPQGVITPDVIFNTKAKAGGDLIYNSELASDLRNISTTSEMLHDGMYSAKELSGIYGFIFSEIMPPTSKQYKLQNASRMESYSRQFWDASVGGLGGEFMEIARRFFPHENHNIEQINPIRNTMPEWMPDRYLRGDPYQALPKGEMRLPGAGYEDINDLHPDQYGKYGAFDRMKILADIAPWSREYKLWRDMATKTVEDPELKEEMKNIRRRVTEQSKQHDFYPYKFIGNKTEEETATIDKILSNNSFSIVGSEDTYKLAGISSVEELENHLQGGMNVRIKTDKNPNYKTNQDGTINALVMTDKGNLNRQLLKSDLAKERDDDSAPGIHARFTNSQMDRGKVYEAIGHAPIPFLHSKLLRIESPIESYKNEEVYGTSFSSWSHPIDGFIKPAFQRAWSLGPKGQALGLASWAAAEALLSKDSSLSGGQRKVVGALWGMTNRGALAGGVMGALPSLAKSDLMKWGATAGSAVGIGGYALTRLDKPVESAINFAMLGSLVGKQLTNSPVKGAGIGAVVGLGLSGMKSSIWDKEKMLGNYIPEDTRKRWDMEEYFDRLKYVKYTGLYEKAARKAKRKENVDIKRLVNKVEYDKKKKEKIRKQLLDSSEKVRNTYGEGDEKREALLSQIDYKIGSLSTPTQEIEAGKYTKAALAYKQAAESTIYGLKEDATWAQILRAVPKNYRDYALEFAKERDPKKREEIMGYFSPYHRKALKVAWGEDLEKQESNLSYFSKKNLPGSSWSGWRPERDIDNIKVKTIDNEGMMLSSFGAYESQLKSPETQMEEPLNYDEGKSGLELRKNLLTALNGAGLMGVDVSIEPSSTPGIQMMANIVRTTDYRLKQSLNNKIGRVFY